LFSPRRDASAAHRFFQQAIGVTKVTPVEVVTDKAVTYPMVLDEVLPGAWHRRAVRQQPHRMRSRPVEGVAATDARAQAGPQRRVVVAGHTLVPNVRRRHDELAVEAPANRRVAVAFDDLVMAI
jgi:transposase, IS6 family